MKLKHDLRFAPLNQYVRVLEERSKDDTRKRRVYRQRLVEIAGWSWERRRTLDASIVRMVATAMVYGAKVPKSFRYIEKRLKQIYPRGIDCRCNQEAELRLRMELFGR